MAAPEGNQFWKLRSKHGRDKLFATPELLLEAACEYFEWCDTHPEYIVEQKKGNQTVKISVSKSKKNMTDEYGEGLNNVQDMISNSNLVYLPAKIPYTLHGLCIYLDCNTVYFNQFESSLKEKTDEMSKDFSKVITRIREIVYNQKFTGATVGYFNSSIIARDLGLQEHHDFSSGDGTMTPQIILRDPSGVDIVQKFNNGGH
jgi:hypothetical protein